MAEYDKLWQDATTEERQQVANIYNKYYNTEEAKDFSYLDSQWKDSKFYTIKYTFGVVPF